MRAARHVGLSPALLAALTRTGSAYQADVVSKAGAIGLTQLMRKTAQELGVNPWDPMENLMGGAQYLRTQLDRFGHTAL